MRTCLSGAIDPRGQALQTLIAVMTAITSGTILAVVTRTNEKVADRRKVVSKVLAARKTIRSYCEAWAAYRSTLDELTDGGQRICRLDGLDLDNEKSSVS